MYILQLTKMKAKPNLPQLENFTLTEEEVAVQTLEYDPSPFLYHFARSSAAHLHQTKNKQNYKSKFSKQLRQQSTRRTVPGS